MQRASVGPREHVRARIAADGFKFTKDGARLGARNAGDPFPAWVCDLKGIMLEPQWIDAYAELFWERFADKLPFQVGGFETAGIPLVTAIVMKGHARGTPVNGFYVRKSRKRYDLMQRIEGTPNAHPVILVDDLVNSGSTLRKHLVELSDAGLHVTDYLAVLAFRDADAYDAAVPVHTLFTLKEFGLSMPHKKMDTPHELFDTQWRYKGEHPSFNLVVQKSRPVLDETHVYFGSDDGVVTALGQATGEPVWTYRIGKHPPGKGILSSPVLHEGTLYIGAYDGVFYAFDARTGSVRWKYDDADWIGSSPCIAPKPGLVYVGLEYGLFRKRGGIAALRMKDGTEVWTDRTAQLTHGSPLYVPEHELVIIGSNDGIVYAYDAATGERRWATPVHSDIKVAPAYASNLVFVPALEGTVYALDIVSGSMRWSFKTGGLYSSPYVRDAYVYVASLDKCIYALDAMTGIEKSRFETHGRIFATPTYADGAIWVGSNDGRLYELAPETLSLRGSHQFSERIVNAVAYSEYARTFFVPTVANEIYCLRRKATGPREAGPSGR